MPKDVQIEGDLNQHELENVRAPLARIPRNTTVAMRRNCPESDPEETESDLIEFS